MANQQQFFGNGSQSYEVTYTQIVGGITTADDTQDGGFSPLSVNTNLISSFGIACPVVLPTVVGLSSTNIPIASCDDFSTVGTPTNNIKYLLKKDTSNNGVFCNVDNTTTITETYTDTANVYSYGISDMLHYNGNTPNNFAVFATTNGKTAAAANQDIVKWQGTSSYTTQSIIAATNTNPCQITKNSHGFVNGDLIYITGCAGMTQLNGNQYRVASAATNTFTLTDINGNAVDSTTYGTYTGSGTMAPALFDPSWWVQAKGQNYLQQYAPHPLQSYNARMYIADKNYLHYLTGATVVANALTLQREQTITALGVDPSSGYLMVAVSNNSVTSNTRPTTSFIGLYDGTNLTQFQKIIPVDDQVSAFYSIGGTVLVLYGLNLGYFTGTGIKFLRKLGNLTFTTSSLPYKPHVTNISNTFYVVNGNILMAFGETMSGSNGNFGVGNKVFYNLLSHTAVIDFVTDIGSGLLLLHDATSNKFYTLNTFAGASASSTMSFYSNNYHHLRPVYIRALDIQLDQNCTGISNVYVIDDTQTANFVGQLSTGVSFQKFVCNLGSLTTKSQILIVNSPSPVGIKSVLVYFDNAE